MFGKHKNSMCQMSPEINFDSDLPQEPKKHVEKKGKNECEGEKNHYCRSLSPEVAKKQHKCKGMGNLFFSFPGGVATDSLRSSFHQRALALFRVVYKLQK